MSQTSHVPTFFPSYAVLHDSLANCKHPIIFCKQAICYYLLFIYYLLAPNYSPVVVFYHPGSVNVSRLFFSPFGPKLSSIKTQFLAKTQIKNFLKLSFSENESKKISYALLNEICERLNIDVFINFKTQNLVKLNSDL